MADYISREKVLEKAQNERIRLGYDVVSVRDIESTPAADVVAVTRCKDCEYWGDESGRMHASDGRPCDRCKAHSYLVGGRYIGLFSKENDFCSYGKRRAKMKECCFTCENLEYQEDYVYPYRCLKHEGGRFSEKELDQMCRESWETGVCDDYKEMEER